MYTRCAPKAKAITARQGSPFAPRPFATLQPRRTKLSGPPLTRIQRAILPHETRLLSRLFGSQIRIWFQEKLKDELALRGGQETVEKNKMISWLPESLFDEIAKVFRGTGFDFKPSDKQNQEIEDLRLRINEGLDQIDLAMENIEYPTMTGIGVGNEFTFTNEAMREAVNGKTKEERAKDMPAPFTTARNKWRGAMSALGFEGTLFTYALDQPQALHYEFPVGKAKWSYDVTMDDGVVEVITSPVKAEDLFTGEIAHMVDAYIFDLANSIDLKAHRDYGSGHINIDLATAIGDSALKLRNFIVVYFNDSSFWKGEDPDYHNAPFPDELPQKTLANNFKKYIAQFDNSLKTDSPWDVARLGETLKERVFNENLVGEPLEDSPHYQAINLEHMGEETKIEERRLEMRRVPAQENRRHLMAQLQRIGRLLDAASEDKPLKLKM